ncbi:MAG: bacterial Ig-like domain-containing protein [Oscillospiraceae bacterium]|nr:bacterial Ig-like domain-containing protein [Oscillospiraceae bacterium]
MKKVFSLLLCLLLVVGCFPMTALADDTTITVDGETSISLTTGVPELASITVTAPTKTQYNVGDELDTTGMVVMANYNYTDDTPKDVTSAVTLSGFDSSSAGEKTVTVSYTEGDVTKTATFTVTIIEPVVTTYTISVSADPAEGGTVSGGGTYDENASITVTATANDNYTFVKWTEDGEEVSTSASYTFTVTGNRTLVAVFEPEQVIYTVTVQPGDGTGTAFTVDSTTVISREEMISGNYDQTKGCFYLDTDGKVYYMFPRQCPFTAPGGKEFDCWQLSSGGTFSGGASLEAGNFTITALYKEPESEPSITLSIPATININYGDTQTAFDIQVKEAVFRNDGGNFEVLFPYSSFQCTSHDGTIPFTVTTNAEGVPNGHHGDKGYFAILHGTPLPFSCQGFINITSDAWAVAKPGNYTATLKVQVVWIQ